MTQESIDHLASVLAREDTILFLGSGVSRWSGLPSWPGLIDQLRDELLRLGRNADPVAREISNNDLLLAASYGADQLTDVERCKYLKSAIQIPGAAPSPLHEAIVGLGPSCYITTNYDRLLEDALTKYRPAKQFDVVTPSDTLEIPAIVQARADYFVFKPHGDIGTCASIVLTREDYRRLQGPGKAVLEAMRLLLVSRPVVFVGFGLRDPDFLLMRDYLFNTFETNPADHLAIMPDVSSDERGYWRRNFGIDLITYDTIPDADPKSQHDNLLQLLERARSSSAKIREAETEEPDLERMALTLARFGRGITSETKPPSDTDFPLTLEQSRDARFDGRLHRALVGSAVTVLADFSGHVIVEGAPGAGKSHTIRNVAKELARRLEAATLSAPPIALDNLRVPVHVTMRDYRDDLMALLETALPVDVPLSLLLEEGIGHFLLDGFNEAALTSERENLLNDQLGRFLQSATKCTVVITTRNSSQLGGANLPVAVMGLVPEKAMHDALRNMGLEPSKTNPMALDLLRRPLFFAAMLDDRISVSESNTVHDIYRQLMAGPHADFASRFGLDVPLLGALASMAFEMIESGDISLPMTPATEALEASLPTNVDPGEVVKYLLQTGILIATPLRKLAFYHHSITEYLAAYHLSELISKDESVVVDCLGRTDWDQALLLALGFLDSSSAEAVHRKIMGADAAMGLRSLHYVETQQEEWIERSLQLLPLGEMLGRRGFALGPLLSKLPLKASHAKALLRLTHEQDGLGGTALGTLAGLLPNHMKSAFDAIVAGKNGYNYCAAIGAALGPQVRAAEAQRLLGLLETVPVNPREADSLLRGEEVRGGELDFVAIRAGAAACFGDLSTDELVKVASQTESALVRTVIADVLRDSRDGQAVDFLRAEIIEGKNYAIVDHYFQLKFGKPKDRPLPPVTSELMAAIAKAVEDPAEGKWALSALVALIAQDAKARELVPISDSSGLGRALLLYAVGDHERFTESLEALLDEGCNWESQPTRSLSGVEDLDTNLLVRMLRTRDGNLAQPVLEILTSITREANDLDLELSDPEWWLGWLGELATAKAFTAFRLGELLAEATSQSTRRALIRIFDTQPEWRPLLARLVLPCFRELSFDDFSPEGVNWLLERASEFVDPWRPSVVARIATEETVQERLLPLFSSISNDDTRTERLRTLIAQVGQAHGRRYIGDDGKVII